MKLLTSTALSLLLISLASVSYSATIISSDTTWSGEITLTESVEIAAGATLTIAAGSEIISNTYGLSISVQGTLKVDGEKDNLVTMPSNVELSVRRQTNGTDEHLIKQQTLRCRREENLMTCSMY